MERSSDPFGDEAALFHNLAAKPNTDSNGPCCVSTLQILGFIPVILLHAIFSTFLITLSWIYNRTLPKVQNLITVGTCFAAVEELSQDLLCNNKKILSCYIRIMYLHLSEIFPMRFNKTYVQQVKIFVGMCSLAHIMTTFTDFSKWALFDVVIRNYTEGLRSYNRGVDDGACAEMYCRALRNYEWLMKFTCNDDPVIFSFNEITFLFI